MAYSGLGSGSQADPYQITTIAQFMEMNSTSYTSSHYFLLMNDLNFSATDSFSLPNFGCNLDGGSHKLQNMRGASFNGFYIKSNTYFKNIEFYITRVSGSSSGFTIFNSSSSLTLSNFNFTGVKVFINPSLTFVYSTYLFNDSITLDSTCTVNNLVIEGKYNYVFPTVKCTIELSSFNLYLGIGKLIQGTASTFIFRKNYLNVLNLESVILQSYSAFTGYLFNNSSGGQIHQNVFRIPIFKDYKSLSTSQFGLINSANSGFYIENNLFLTKDLYSLGYTCVAIRTTTLSCNFYVGNINTPNHVNARVFNNDSNSFGITNNYFKKSKITSNIPTEIAGVETGLTDANCLLESSYTGWDFTNIWQIGTEHPELRNVAVPTFYYANNQCVHSCERTNSSSFLIRLLTTDESSQFGCDVFDSSGSNLLFSFENSVENTVSALTSDTTFLIKSWVIYQGTKIYQYSTTYTHYFLNSATTTIKVIANTYSTLQNGEMAGRYIHGSCATATSIYGSSRGDITNNTNYCSIVKVPIADPTAFSLINIYGDMSNLKVCNMDSLVRIGDFLYTIAFAPVGGYAYLVKFSLATDDYQIFKTNVQYTGAGFPSCTDGSFLYVYVSASKIYKVDVSIFSSAEKFNVLTTYSLGNTYYLGTPNLSDTTIETHTMVVDNEFLYIGFGTSSSTGQHEIHKVRKSDMTFVSKAFVPKMTDDMCQTTTHLFIGIELYTPTNSNSFGYGWGTCAIRKSDMKVTKLPKLHSTQNDSNQSYASLIFGNYLIEARNTGGYIYVIDISDVDNWTLSENIGQRTVAAYQVYKTNGITLSNPVNEIFLPENGRFIGFGWNSISDVLSFDLPGVNFFAAPTVLSLAAHIINNNQIQLSGNVFYNGGQSVTAQGFIVSPNNDLSGGTIYNCDSLDDFTKVINALPNGTYYWTAFAVNQTGQSAANKQVFSFTKYNSRLKIVIAGQSFYSENNQIYALKEI